MMSSRRVRPFNACAQALQHAGARRLAVLTIARSESFLPVYHKTMSNNPLTASGFFPKPDYGKTPSKKKEMPEGLWTKCPSCSAYIFNKELESLQMVCKECGHHFNITAHARLGFLLDEGSWEEHDANISPVDILKFTGAKSYSDQIKKYQKETGLKEGVVCGHGQDRGARRFRRGDGVQFPRRLDGIRHGREDHARH